MDVQARIVQALLQLHPDISVSGREPDDFSTAIVAQTDRAGKFDGVTMTHYIRLRCYAPARDDCIALMLTARQEMLSLSGHSLPDGTQLLDKVKVDSEPVELFHSDNITMFSSVFSVATRDTN